MKKSLVALAALAAGSTFAQSTVSLSGLVDIGYRTSVNAPGTTSDTKGLLGSGGSATTAILIQGSEDLGGGLKANFRYEINPDFTSGTGLVGSVTTETTTPTSTATAANGYNFLGISGGFGEVKLGRLNTGTLAAWGTASVFGTALGSGYGSSGQYTRYASAISGTHQTAPTRFNNAVEYTTPTMSGLSARLLYVPQVNSATTLNAASVNRVGVTDISVAYAAGPLNVNVAQQKVTTGSNGVDFTQVLVGTGSTGATADGTVASNKLTTVAAGYTIGAARIQGGYWTETSGTAVDTKGYIVGGRYTFGATTVMASMAKSDDKTTSNIDRKIFGIGADYALSKRTSLWARYESRDANTNSATDDSTNGVTKTTAVGIRHTF